MAQNVWMNARRAIVLVAFLTLVGLAGFLAMELVEERWKTRIRDEDEPFVRLAYLREGATNDEGVRHLMKPFYPRVIRFPNEVCVQLNSKMGWTDGGSIYCFDPKNRNATRSFPVRP